MKHGYTESELSTARVAFEAAVARMTSKTRLAAALGISRPAISQWDTVPVGRAEEVARLTGIPFERLCPGRVRPSGGAPET